MKNFLITKNIKPPLNAFDHAHNHMTTMTMGKVYPMGWLECVPGDIYKINFQSLIRALPLVAPILNNLTVSIDVYFCPTRLLWSDRKWEKYISTVDNDVIPNVPFDELQPTWMQSDKKTFKSNLNLDYSNGSLWRCFGFNSLLKGAKALSQSTSKYFPVDWLRRAYWLIYNEWYRDQHLNPSVDFMNPDTDKSGMDQQRVFTRAWRPDYFTKAMTQRQQGIAPSIPITGYARAVFPNWRIWLDLTYNDMPDPNLSLRLNNFTKNGEVYSSLRTHSNEISSAYSTTGACISSTSNNAKFINWLNQNKIDLSDVGTFSVNDMRDMFGIQRFFEGLMRMGSRYIEVLQGIYGVSPTDARLSIPERVGGAEFNISISEVLQTSETSDFSELGNQAGHGLGVSAGSLGTYKCEEFGYILILVDIQPPAVYKQRFPREMYRKSLLDQYTPYFVNLSYQAINNREIYGQLNDTDNDIWAFAGRYDEMREKMSYASGELIDKQPYYLNSREFASLPGYNADFIRCEPNLDIFAVLDEDPFVCNFYWDIEALRPLPIISEPGLIDHVYGG